MKSSQIGNYNLVPGHKPFSGRISVMSYTVSGGLLEAKINQVKHCFNMIWKSKGSLLTMGLLVTDLAN